MDTHFLAQALTAFIALLIALCIHEAAHAFSAKLQGDSTAEDQGRLTLNPIAHIDFFGTILLPLSAILLKFPFLFGWAKPVPVNPYNFKNPRWGHVIVAAAGPVSNLLLTLLCMIAYIIYEKFFITAIPESSFFYPLITLLIQIMWISAILAFFNLLPIPPLDGGTVLPAFLPTTLREFFEDYIAPYGTIILIVLLISGGLSVVFWLAKAYVMLLQNMFSIFL